MAKGRCLECGRIGLEWFRSFCSNECLARYRASNSQKQQKLDEEVLNREFDEIAHKHGFEKTQWGQTYWTMRDFHAGRGSGFFRNFGADYAGTNQHPKRPEPPPQRFISLHIFGTVTSFDQVKKMYRDLAKKRHPDHGGSKAAMQELNVAYDNAKKVFGV